MIGRGLRCGGYSISYGMDLKTLCLHKLMSLRRNSFILRLGLPEDS